MGLIFIMRSIPMILIFKRDVLMGFTIDDMVF